MPSWICCPFLVTQVNWRYWRFITCSKESSKPCGGTSETNLWRKTNRIWFKYPERQANQDWSNSNFLNPQRIDNVDPATWFNTAVGDSVTVLKRNTANEGHLLSNQSNTDKWKNFFTNRVVPVWNALPTELKKLKKCQDI